MNTDDFMSRIRAEFAMCMYEPNTEETRIRVEENLKSLYRSTGFDPANITVKREGDTLTMQFKPSDPEEFEALAGKSAEQALLEAEAAGDEEHASGLRNIIKNMRTKIV